MTKKTLVIINIDISFINIGLEPQQANQIVPLILMLNFQYERYFCLVTASLNDFFQIDIISYLFRFTFPIS